MSIFKRAFLYVTRKRGKTILLFTILMIMATFVGIIFIPALFALFETIKEWSGGGKAEKKIQEQVKKQGNPLEIKLDDKDRTEGGEQNG